MKKLLYEVIGNIYEIAFPKKLIKDRRSLLLVVLESCRYMMQNETVDHADNIMVLSLIHIYQENGKGQIGRLTRT